MISIRPSFCRCQALVVFLLFLLGLSLRAALVSQGPYSHDCLLMAQSVEAALDAGRIPILHSHGFPLTAWLAAVAIFIDRLFPGGDPVRAVNLMSVVFSSLCVFPLFAFAHRLFGFAAAFFATVIFLFSPIFLSVSIYGNSHSPALFFFLLALSVLARALDDGSLRQIVGAGLLLGLAAAARIQDAFLVSPAVGVLFCWPWRRTIDGRERLGRGFIFVLCAVLMAGVFYLPVVWNRPGGYTADFFRSEVWNCFLGNSGFLITSARQMLDHASLLGILLAGDGAVLLTRMAPRKGLFLGLWFLAPFLFYGNLYMQIPRLLVVATVPLALWAGLALAGLWLGPVELSAQTGGRRSAPGKQVPGYVRLGLRITAIVVLACLLAISLSKMIPILAYRHNHSLTVDFARWVGQVTEPDAIVISGDERRFLATYSGREAISTISVLSDEIQLRPQLSTELREFKNQIDALLRRGRPVYITQSALYSYDDGIFSSFIKEAYRLTDMGARPLEDWHRSCIRLTLVRVGLFKLSFPVQNSMPPPGD